MSKFSYLLFPVSPLIRRSCMSELTLNITFPPAVNLSNFVKPPAFDSF